VWQILAVRDVFPRVLISSPSLVAHDFIKLVTEETFRSDLGVTLTEALLGLAFGTVVGTLAGTVLALLPRYALAVQPLVVAIHSLPFVIIAPLFALWFGFGEFPKILLAALAVLFVVFFNALAGASSVERHIIDQCRILGFGRFWVMRSVIVPSTLAWVMAAMKNAISFAFLAVIVGEYVGSTNGLGTELTTAAGLLNSARLVSLLLSLAIIGVILAAIAGAIERWVLRWR
jgi:NitT/TauT family transport system permease protein